MLALMVSVAGAVPLAGVTVSQLPPPEIVVAVVKVTPAPEAVSCTVCGCGVFESRARR